MAIFQNQTLHLMEELDQILGPITVNNLNLNQLISKKNLIN